MYFKSPLSFLATESCPSHAFHSNETRYKTLSFQTVEVQKGCQERTVNGGVSGKP